MKFLASALLALLLVPVESALGQEPALQPDGCILGANRKKMQVQFRNHKTHSNP